MGMLDELRDLGVDVDKALKLLGGKTALYERLLFKFVNLVQKTDIRTDFDSNDYKSVMEATHTLKGSAGNLSITPLFKAYADSMQLFRDGKPEEAREVLIKVIPIRDEILACIEKYREV